MEAIIALNVVSYTKGNRSVYSLNIHLVLVSKYRRQVITIEILQRLREIFDATCTKWRCTLKEFKGESDHVHLVISFPPDVQVSTLVGNLKTVSSRLIRKNLPTGYLSFTGNLCFGQVLILSLVAVV
jgi:putative transposase